MGIVFACQLSTCNYMYTVSIGMVRMYVGTLCSSWQINHKIVTFRLLYCNVSIHRNWHHVRIICHVVIPQHIFIVRCAPLIGCCVRKTMVRVYGCTCVVTSELHGVSWRHYGAMIKVTSTQVTYIRTCVPSPPLFEQCCHKYYSQR